MFRGTPLQQARKQIVWQTFTNHKIMVIVRLTYPAPLVDIVRALVEGGVRVIEIPLTTPGALDAITQCRRFFGEDAIVGTGSIFAAADARRAVDAGAQFLASFGCTAAVVAVAQTTDGVLALPNALTPSEIVEAWQVGADAVKVFPAHAFGPDYLTALRGPLPHIPLVVSGGISTSAVAGYVRAGAAAVGVSDLFTPDVLAADNWAMLTERARVLTDIALAKKRTAASDK